MPLVKIITNVSKNKIPQDFLEKLIPVMASAIGKPKERCVCSVSDSEQVCFGGDKDQPAAIATLVSIGHLSPRDNYRISRDLSLFLEKEIGVASNRFFITFHDQEPWSVGVQGTTVYERDALTNNITTK